MNLAYALNRNAVSAKGIEIDALPSVSTEPVVAEIHLTKQER